MARRNMTLKLMVNKATQRVLFAEAGKEVVDSLFCLLALPVGTVKGLLAAKGMVGCVGELYDSLERLDGAYVLADFNKDALLKPTMSSDASRRNHFLLQCSKSASGREFYGCDRHCSSGSGFITDCAGVACPGCRRPMTSRVTCVAPEPEMVEADAGKGYVQGVVSYMVMDDLAVEPMSSISCVTLLNKFHIREVGALEERTVELGWEEELELLKAAFQSKTVLSDVFLRRTVT